MKVEMQKTRNEGMKTCEDIKNANKIKTEQIKKYEEHGQK